ncbi:hypothetical protein TIFTF001_043073 [Ficus carica]|uniref:Disease resistance N-terminal domain-containing protein n=1 Tax=Ficus carica TaxID=3494 RepID=A0AA87YQE6_FICCA|nr:hypothetical protein TIFTF001_043073 [Ficus carica]
MADAAVSFVIKRPGDLLIADAKFLYGVRGQVEDAQAKLTRMRCFLKDANAYERDGDERRISHKISSLTSDLQAHGVRELRFKEGASSSIREQRELRRAYSHVDEQDCVGLDDDINKLVALLTGKVGHNPPSCGVDLRDGWFGENHSCEKGLSSSSSQGVIFDCFALTSISQQCKIRVVWEEILINLTAPTVEKINDSRGMTNGEVAKELYDVQKKIEMFGASR